MRYGCELSCLLSEPNVDDALLTYALLIDVNLQKQKQTQRHNK